MQGHAGRERVATWWKAGRCDPLMRHHTCNDGRIYMDLHATSRRLPVILALIATFAWGCGGGDRSGGTNGADGAAAGRSASSTSLQAVNESGMAGSLRLDPGGDSVTVKLEVLGVTSDTEYDVPLRRGGCDAEGEQIAEVGSPTVATVGLGSSLVRLPISDFPAEGRVSVWIYLPDGRQAGCAEVGSPRGARSGQGGET